MRVNAEGTTKSACECNECGREWLALHIAGCDNLICPYCNSRDTLRYEPYPPKIGTAKCGASHKVN